MTESGIQNSQYEPRFPLGGREGGFLSFYVNVSVDNNNFGSLFFTSEILRNVLSLGGAAVGVSAYNRDNCSARFAVSADTRKMLKIYADTCGRATP
jgi:hypothetical protein